MNYTGDIIISIAIIGFIIFRLQIVKINEYSRILLLIQNEKFDDIKLKCFIKSEIAYLHSKSFKNKQMFKKVQIYKQIYVEYINFLEEVLEESINNTMSEKNKEKLELYIKSQFINNIIFKL